MRNAATGYALGYEDLNDHDQLRSDPALAVMIGKEEVDHLMVDVFVKAQTRQPKQIILDLDVTNDLIHGKQEDGSFMATTAILPLYIFVGEFLLCARLRSADGDATDGALDELKRIIQQIRQSWPKVHILVRADSGFCRDEILTWCERNGVDYVIGFSRNDRLIAMIDMELQEARQEFEKSRNPARVFKDVYYRTRESWSRTRRVIAKAVYQEKGSNPRFIVTSLPKHGFEAAPVYFVFASVQQSLETFVLVFPLPTPHRSIADSQNLGGLPPGDLLCHGSQYHSLHPT